MTYSYATLEICSEDRLASARAWLRAIWLADNTPEAATLWNVLNAYERRPAGDGRNQRDRGRMKRWVAVKVDGVWLRIGSVTEVELATVTGYCGA